MTTAAASRECAPIIVIPAFAGRGQARDTAMGIPYVVKGGDPTSNTERTESNIFIL